MRPNPTATRWEATRPGAAPGPALVVLIPAVRQALWGWPAVVNFAAGGVGAGLYAATWLVEPPAAAFAAWLAPALVILGFVAVATEAGRPFRGPRVLTAVRTSWMSRELWLGGAFTLLAATEPVLRVSGQRLVATALALGLALAQGAILREARGVAAWAVPVMPLLFLSSALASGAALLLGVLAWSAVPAPRLLGAVLALGAVHLLVWWRYLESTREPGFVAATRPLREGRHALAVVGLSYLAPSVLLPLALVLPGWAAPLAGLGAGLLVGGHTYMKAALVLAAGVKRPVTLPSLGRRSR